jgi:predicted HNH restriction endonuclease
VSGLSFVARRYLETHHVIFLAHDGADKPTNVIALCPNDHREAHFGKRSAGIEAEMILKLKATCRVLKESDVLR